MSLPDQRTLTPAAPGLLARVLASHSRRATAVPAGDVVLLDSGDPDFHTPQPIVQALRDAIDAGGTHYGDPFGDPRLRARLAEQESMRSARPVTPDQVIVTHGASGGLGAAFLATLDPGDRVLIPDPTYSLYADQIRLAGAVPVPVPTRPDFHLDLDALSDAAAGARMVVLCNPCNPTGVVYGGHELEAVAALRDDLLVLVDEAYDSIVYPPTRFASAMTIPALADRLIYVQTFSKRYAMTGWRIGYVIAPPALAGAVGKMHFTLHGPPNTAVQQAALAATELEPPSEFFAEYARRREHVMTRLATIPGLHAAAPEGTFYVFLGYRSPMDSVTVLQRCLEHGVALRAGSEFGDGGEGHLRLSFTAPLDVLDRGLDRLQSAMIGP